MTRLILILTVLISLVLVTPVQAQQGITLLPPSVEVSNEMLRAVIQYLSDNRPTPSVYYSISHVDEFTPGVWWVSLAAFDRDYGARWYYRDAIWTGAVIVSRGAGPDGLVVTESPTGGAGMYTEVDSDQPLGTDAVIPILPWAKDRQALYGNLGVHSDNLYYDWAVDFVFTPSLGTANQVYAAMPGTVTAICNDGTTTALKIERFGYLHFVDAVADNYTIGQSIAQAQPLGALQTGDFDDNCGYADQANDNWHLHFEFNSDSYGGLSIDDYRLTVSTDEFYKKSDGSTIDPGEYILSTWLQTGGTEPPVPPPPAPPPTETDNANNFWGWILSGLWSIVGAVLPALTDYQSRGIAETMTSNAQLYLQIVYVIALTNFNLTIPLILISTVMTMELIRVVYSAWMWVKRAIPFVG